MNNKVEIRRTVSDAFHKLVDWWTSLPDLFHAVLGALLVMIPISPLFMPVIRRDSGVFLYMAWRILSGEVPYRDLWDHKPPLILYLNAAGLALGNGSRWGVWVLEMLCLILAILLGIKILKRAFGRSPALLATYVWLVGATGLLSGGNYTTEYALPAQFGCYWLYCQAERQKSDIRHFYLIGILCGIIFFLKQNAVGVGIAIMLHMIVTKISARQIGTALANLGASLGGALTVAAVILLTLWRQQALVHFWESVFIYNFSYISAGIPDRIEAIIKGMVYLSGITLFAGAGWLITLLLFLNRIRLRQTLDTTTSTLLAVGWVQVPVELLLLAMTGNSFRHYYLTLLPVFALFTGFTLWAVGNQVASPATTPRIKKYLQVFSPAFLTVSILAAAVALSSDLSFASRRPVDTLEVIEYIQAHSTADDYVLMWGAEAGFNFAAQRRSPSRFSYQYPLYLDGYFTAALVEEFLEEIQTKRPVLIIDTHNSSTPIYEFKVTSSRIEELTKAIRSQYRPIQDMGSWTVYKLTSSPN